MEIFEGEKYKISTFDSVWLSIIYIFEIKKKRKKGKKVMQKFCAMLKYS